MVHLVLGAQTDLIRPADHTGQDGKGVTVVAPCKADAHANSAGVDVDMN